MSDELDLVAKRAEAFKKAYAVRFDESDVDWKPTRYKDKSTGSFVEGKKLAYLNWAVAWRAMLEVYPDAEFRLLEHDGDPLWVINGYGFVKCAVSALGVERVETFPIMSGGASDSMKAEEIDGRDVNDSAQRGLTKCIARFGIGLYIYEGKAPEGKNEKKPSFVPHPEKTYEPKKETAQTAQEPQKQAVQQPSHASGEQLASQAQKNYIKKLMDEKGYAKSDLPADPDKFDLTKKEGSLIIDFLVKAEMKAKEEPSMEEIPDAELPF